MTKPGGVQTFSPETDVYSLGATLYYLVSGQNPPDASERMEMIMDGEKFKLPETLSATTANAIEQSMQARKKRIQSVDEFVKLLNADKDDERLEAERKAAAEAEAKRQEELRLERIAEEKEKQEVVEQERLKAVKKAEDERKEARKTIQPLQIIMFIVTIVMFVLFEASWDPVVFGIIGFAAAIVTIILSWNKKAKFSVSYSIIFTVLAGLLGLIMLLTP